MNALTQMLSPLAEGWVMALFHSLWQGALIAGLVFLVLWMFNIRNPRVRYGLGVAGLVVFLMTVGITLFHVMPEQPANSGISEPVSEVTFVQMVSQGMAATETGWSILFFLQENMPFILKLWAVGAILLMFRIAGGYQYLRKVVKRSEDSVPENWIRMIDRIASRLEIGRDIRVLHSSHIGMPMVFGHARPVLLLPVSLLTGMTTDQLEAIFAHELAHIRRHDYLVNVVQQIMEAMFFFNPFVWILSNHLRTEREKCCDDLAMEICHNERQYVEALSTLELYRVNAPGNAMMLLGKKGELLARIRRLTDPSYGEMGSSKWVVMIVLSASFFLFSYFTQPGENSISEVPVVVKKQQPLIAGMPTSLITPLDTIPEEEEIAIDLDVDQDIEFELEEIIEEEFELDGAVHVYSYSSDTVGPFEIRIGPDGGWSKKILEFTDMGNYAFVMPDTDFDVRTWVSDKPGAYTFYFSDTIPGNFFLGDSLMSEEDREMMEKAQEEMRKAQEEMQRAREQMHEEQERLREIMRKYREEHPELMEEHQKAMREMQRELRSKQFEVIVDGDKVERIVRAQQRQAELQMHQAQRELERAQREIRVVRPGEPARVIRMESRPFFDRNRMQSFEQEVAEMLRADDYLNNDDELKKIELTQDYFKYNGKKVKGGDFQRYLRAYESRFGNIDGKINIQLDN